MVDISESLEWLKKDNYKQLKALLRPFDVAEPSSPPSSQVYPPTPPPPPTATSRMIDRLNKDHRFVKIEEHVPPNIMQLMQCHTDQPEPWREVVFMLLERSALTRTSPPPSFPSDIEDEKFTGTKAWWYQGVPQHTDNEWKRWNTHRSMLCYSGDDPRRGLFLKEMYHRIPVPILHQLEIRRDREEDWRGITLWLLEYLTKDAPDEPFSPTRSSSSAQRSPPTAPSKPPRPVHNSQIDREIEQLLAERHGRRCRACRAHFYVNGAQFRNINVKYRFCERCRPEPRRCSGCGEPLPPNTRPYHTKHYSCYIDDKRQEEAGRNKWMARRTDPCWSVSTQSPSFVRPVIACHTPPSRMVTLRFDVAELFLVLPSIKDGKYIRFALRNLLNSIYIILWNYSNHFGRRPFLLPIV